AGGQVATPDGIDPDPLDDPGDQLDGRRIVAGNIKGAPLGICRGPALLVELVVAEMVQRLDHPRAGQAASDNLAARQVFAGEALEVAVDGRPVVHHVDHDLAGEQIRV